MVTREWNALSTLAACSSRYIYENLDQVESSERQAVAYSMASSLPEVNKSERTIRRPKPRRVRALQRSPEVFAAACDPKLYMLMAAAWDSFPHVNWTEFYSKSKWSNSFLSEFANGEGIGPDGVLLREDLILGLFILGPNTSYPPHAHPAEEIYIVLSGNPEFSVGAGNSYSRRKPGDIIVHLSEESHAIRTGNETFFGIFCWTGQIAEPSWYRDDMADGSLPKRFPNIAKC